MTHINEVLYAKGAVIFRISREQTGDALPLGDGDGDSALFWPSLSQCPLSVSSLLPGSALSPSMVFSRTAARVEPPKRSEIKYHACRGVRQCALCCAPLKCIPLVHSIPFIGPLPRPHLAMTGAQTHRKGQRCKDIDSTCLSAISFHCIKSTKMQIFPAWLCLVSADAVLDLPGNTLPTEPCPSLTSA